MKSIAVVILLIIGFGHCQTRLTPQTADDLTDTLTIRTGTAFGMCAGEYCIREYVFNGTHVTLTHKGARSQAAAQSCQSTISAADWIALKASVNLASFNQQPAVLGCPDCADGGAEFIELQVGEQKHRVTFPVGETIPGFESLVTGLRNQRNAFSECK
ncbi:hypothetical protein GCM10028808_02630 [Spirosoma migulaei]